MGNEVLMRIRATFLVAVMLAGLVACRPIEAVDVDASGAFASPYGTSDRPSISDDGRRVAFSVPGRLTSADTNGVSDVYVRDRGQRTTILASVSPEGRQAPDHVRNLSLSGDGHVAAWMSADGGPLLLPPGSIGTYLYAKDLRTGVLERIAINGAGVDALSTGEAPILDRTGRHVLFVWTRPLDEAAVQSAYVFDRETKVLTPAASDPSGKVVAAFPEAISGDGTKVLFVAGADVLPGVSGGVFLRDLTTGETRLVSADSNGAQVPGTFKADLSGDGTVAVFTGVEPPYSVYRKDLRTGALRRLDRKGCNGPVAESSGYVLATVSDDGRAVAFFSSSPDLVPGDDNGHEDVFVWRAQLPCRLTLVSGTVRKPGDGGSYWPAISGNGRSVAFVSEADNLVEDDGNGHSDVFVVDLLA